LTIRSLEREIEAAQSIIAKPATGNAIARR